MRTLAALSLTLAQGACVATAPVAPVPAQPLRVSNGGQPFQLWEGAAARKVADQLCGARGVRTSIYDRYDRATGEWVYPEGCA